MAPRPAQRLAGLALALAAGCGAPERFAGVYEEVSVIPADRDWALRLTMFAYAGRGGGYVEFFPVDVGNNTRQEPYFSAASCAWFGADPYRDGEVRFVMPGVDGTDLRLWVEFGDGGDIAIATIRAPGGLLADGATLPEEGLRFTLERTSESPDERCDPRLPSNPVVGEGSGLDARSTDGSDGSSGTP